MFVSLPSVLRSIHRDYIACYLWATTVSCCLGIRGLFFIQVIQTASLPLYRCRNWDLEKIRDGSKVTQSLHSSVQYRSSSSYRTYIGLYVHQCVKVWQTESYFPTLVLQQIYPRLSSVPPSRISIHVEVFSYTLWLFFYHPLSCLFFRVVGPALDRGSLCCWAPAQAPGQSPSERMLCLSWECQCGLQQKSDCIPGVMGWTVSP